MAEVKLSYSDKLKDPRWQKKRLKVLERDEWTCHICGATDKPLNVHHTSYRKEPWDGWSNLITLCEDCHHEEHTKVHELTKVMLFRLKNFGYTSKEIGSLCDIFNHNWGKEFDSKLVHIIRVLIVNDDLKNQVFELIDNYTFEEEE